MSLVFSFAIDKTFRSVPLSIYYHSNPNLSSLLCENGSGPIKYLPLSIDMGALSVEGTRKALQEERDSASWF